MFPVVATYAPRIIIPAFFISQSASKIPDRALLSQTVAFSFLFISTVMVLFQGDAPWLALIPGIAAISYSAMMKDPTNVEKYRYADWALTTPLMLLAILLSIKADLLTIVTLLLSDLVMIGAGYKGVQEKDERYFWIGLLAFVPILATLVTATTNKPAIYLTLALWLLYPIVYYLNEKQTINDYMATQAYSIMDVVAKVGLVNLLKF